MLGREEGATTARIIVARLDDWRGNVGGLAALGGRVDEVRHEGREAKVAALGTRGSLSFRYEA
jgi:hypothetical protein